MNLQPKILMGITGGVAAFRAAGVASRLVQENCEVRVAMTQSAAHFVAPLTFSALTRKPVLTSLFPNAGSGEMETVYPHLYPATRVDVFVVIPATADIIAKLANGFGDDIVCCSALSLKADCKRIFCPAMNVQMWENPLVQENCSRLVKQSWKRIGPEKGHLACGTLGEGRMSDPEIIVRNIMSAVFE